MKKLISIGRFIDRFNDRVGVTLSWLALIMTLLGVYNAITRKLSQTIGIDLSSNMYLESQWYMFSLIFLWGGAYALRHGVHVRVDIIYSHLSNRGKAWINTLGTLLFLIPLCLLILWVSIPYVAASWRILEDSPDPGGLPRYIIKTAIPVAFLLLLLQALSELIRNIARLRGFLEYEEAKEEPESAL